MKPSTSHPPRRSYPRRHSRPTRRRRPFHFTPYYAEAYHTTVNPLMLSSSQSSNKTSTSGQSSRFHALDKRISKYWLNRDETIRSGLIFDRLLRSLAVHVTSVLLVHQCCFYLAKLSPVASSRRVKMIDSGHDPGGRLPLSDLPRVL